MAIFEEEPGDYGDSGDSGNDAPPAPWEYEPELPPEIVQGEDRPVTDPSDYELPPSDDEGGGEEPPPERPPREPNDAPEPQLAGPKLPIPHNQAKPANDQLHNYYENPDYLHWPALPKPVEGPKMPAQLLDKKFAQMEPQWYDPKSGRWVQPNATGPDASDDRDLDYSKYDKTLDYMYDEMIRNVDSRQVKDIQSLIDFVGNPEIARYGHSTEYYIAALSEWAGMVATGREWDHKPKLENMLGLKEAKDYYFPIRGDTEHEYHSNIWSNIHYGYVGSAAGLDAETLHRGGDSQIPFTPYGYDPTSAISIQIGIDLWNQKGKGLRPEDIQQAILAHTQDYVRDYGPNQPFEPVIQNFNGR